MKTYVRDLINDLRQPKNSRDFIPPVPPPSTDAVVTDLDPSAAPIQPDDLENQELSTDPAERVRQLDQQAQDAEVRETLE
jgi:hypothetical protein